MYVDIPDRPQEENEEKAEGQAEGKPEELEKVGASTSPIILPEADNASCSLPNATGKCDFEMVIDSPKAIDVGTTLEESPVQE